MLFIQQFVKGIDRFFIDLMFELFKLNLLGLELGVKLGQVGVELGPLLINFFALLIGRLDGLIALLRCVEDLITVKFTPKKLTDLYWASTF